MNKILAGIFVYLMLTLNVAAQETPNSETIEPLQPENAPKLYWMQMPVICGLQKNVEEYLREFKFVMANMSVGRENARPDSPIVYYVTYWISEDFTQSIAVVTNMSGTESCMMYKSFDLQWTEPPKLGENL